MNEKSSDRTSKGLWDVLLDSTVLIALTSALLYFAGYVYLLFYSREMGIPVGLFSFDTTKVILAQPELLLASLLSAIITAGLFSIGIKFFKKFKLLLIISLIIILYIMTLTQFAQTGVKNARSTLLHPEVLKASFVYNNIMITDYYFFSRNDGYYYFFKPQKDKLGANTADYPQIMILKADDVKQLIIR